MKIYGPLNYFLLIDSNTFVGIDDCLQNLCAKVYVKCTYSSTQPVAEVRQYQHFPVKNYRRGIANFFGVILLKRRRSVHFMGVTRPRNWRRRPFLDDIYICSIISRANNCEDNCVCIANNNCEGDIHIVAFTIIGHY